MSGSRLIDTLAGKVTDRPPFWFMRQAGRYLPEYRELRAKAGSFLDLCYTPEWAAEVTLQPLRRFDMDAAILFSDILVVPHALGQALRFAEGEGPKLPPIRTAEDMARLSPHRVMEHIQPVLETVRRVRAQLAPEKTLIGFAGAPWTVACYMVEGGGSKDFASVRRMAIEEPGMFTVLMGTVIDATVDYLSAQIQAGAECIQLFDSWAGILSAEDFLRWVVAANYQVIERLRQLHPEIPIIGFPKTSSPCLDAYMQTTEVDGISIDYALPMEWARDHLSPYGAVQGNLDPMLLAASAELAIEEAGRLREIMKEKPFIFNLGHGMLPHTPVAHVEALSAYLMQP